VTDRLGRFAGRAARVKADGQNREAPAVVTEDPVAVVDIHGRAFSCTNTSDGGEHGQVSREELLQLHKNVVG